MEQIETDVYKLIVANSGDINEAIAQILYIDDAQEATEQA